MVGHLGIGAVDDRLQVAPHLLAAPVEGDFLLRLHDAHAALLEKYTDEDMHNVLAYLQTLR